MSTHSWRIAWWTLFAFWIACAILGMNHIRAGGVFPGVFDYFDILGYAIGLSVCYVFDKRSVQWHHE